MNGVDAIAGDDAAAIVGIDTADTAGDENHAAAAQCEYEHPQEEFSLPLKNSSERQRHGTRAVEGGVYSGDNPVGIVRCNHCKASSSAFAVMSVEEIGDNAMTDEAEACEAVRSLARYELVHGCLRYVDGPCFSARTMGPVGLSFVDQQEGARRRADEEADADEAALAQTDAAVYDGKDKKVDNDVGDAEAEGEGVKDDVGASDSHAPVRDEYRGYADRWLDSLSYQRLTAWEDQAKGMSRGRLVDRSHQ